tara:strand:- start:69 stop:260 length:192 start_codon:yes stop_codon:yes gene_type:complete
LGETARFGYIDIVDSSITDKNDKDSQDRVRLAIDRHTTGCAASQQYFDFFANRIDLNPIVFAA